MISAVVAKPGRDGVPSPSENGEVRLMAAQHERRNAHVETGCGIWLHTPRARSVDLMSCTICHKEVLQHDF